MRHLLSCSFARPVLRRCSTRKVCTVSLKETAQALRVRLTHDELTLLHTTLDVSADGILERTELELAGKTELERQWTRDVLLKSIEQPRTALDRLGTKMVGVLDVLGTALFACVGTQIAGCEAGMNVVGCALVGCVAAMGGGTVNNLLFGGAREGVFWVRDPRFLMVALASSLATFVGWPRYCRYRAQSDLEAALARDECAVGASTFLSRGAFVRFIEQEPEYKQRACSAFGVDANRTTAEALFALVDEDHSGRIEVCELCRVAKLEFDQSTVVYALDTLSLAALSVVSVNGAVARGMHPLVAAASGVICCFGGLLRDVLCGRNLAIGGQSSALATGAGATVYVGLRELALRGGPALPLVARIVMSGSTVVALRAYEWVSQQPLLQPMVAKH